MPDISNLGRCINDVRTALASSPVAPSFRPYASNYRQLLVDLQRAAQFLPPAYQEAAVVPFTNYLSQLGEWGFYQLFFPQIQPTEEQEFLRAVIPDISLALLLNGQPGGYRAASAAFQEVVSDLYDGFLADEQRISNTTGQPIKPPDLETLPPLIKWGSPDAGPYILPADVTARLGLKIAIVNLPPTFAQKGLLSWATLGHETSGHGISHADVGLLDELQERIRNAVFSTFGSGDLALVWAQWADEAMADVAGYLNMGPAAAMSLLGFFRALSQDGRLRSVGTIGDPHPIDVLRGFLAARVIGQLHFREAQEWSDLIYRESIKDAPRFVHLVDPRTGARYPFMDAATGIRSAALVADVILKTRLNALEGHSLLEIKDWTDADQVITERMGLALRTGNFLPAAYRGENFYAAHAVAAATTEGLKNGANVQLIFNRMLRMLGTMHEGSATWGRSGRTLAGRVHAGAPSRTQRWIRPFPTHGYHSASAQTVPTSPTTPLSTFMYA